jgi:hypothetical protein
MALAAIDMQKKSDDLSVAFLGMRGGLVFLGWSIAMHPALQERVQVRSIRIHAACNPDRYASGLASA